MRTGLRAVARLGLAIGLAIAPAAALPIDLQGIWYPIFHEDQPERVPGPDQGDFLGLPINDAARLRADSWDPNILTVPEHQCKPHPANYGTRGVGQMRIWEDRDPVSQQLVKLNTQIQWQEQRRYLWLNGKAPPPDFAPHTWQGFSSARFEGDVLVVDTTRIKAGWIRRNGLALSDRTHMQERFIRHGDILTHVYMVEDPVYLTEAVVRTTNYQLVLNGIIDPYPCRYAIEIDRPRSVVPHKLPGTNHASEEYAKRHNIPVEAVRGGAATAMPEFLDTLRKPAAR